MAGTVGNIKSSVWSDDLTPEDNQSTHPSILFVCTANRIRSALAEAVMVKFLEEKGIDPSTWLVESAGTWTLDGLPVFPEVLTVAKEKGIDLSSHRSRLITADMLAGHNLVLVMESGQKEALQFEFPRYGNRIFLVSEMVGLNLPVNDPLGGELPAYRDLLEQIEAYIRDGFERISEMASLQH